ncbi:hypothetical protein JTB14_005290 [Gonioctena quinquepunctata]|nr:hypothetical protein JTB14_005290 [Gonioctena quinquepunctata]
MYAKKGQKQVGIAISAERGQTYHYLCAVSAAGSYVPPTIIYPRKRFRAASIFLFNPDKFTAEDSAPPEQFREHILHINPDEGKMNINLPAPQIPIPEAIAEPIPSISATVLEPTPSTSIAILETSLSFVCQSI